VPRRRRDPPAAAGPPATSRAGAPAAAPREPAPAGVHPELSPRDERIALAIAQGSTQTAAARLASCGVRTVYDAIRRPAVAARIQGLRREVVAEAMSRLTSLAGEAVEVMASIMRGDVPDTAPAVRLWAAQAVLSQTLRLAEHCDLSADVAALRGQLAAAGLPSPGDLD
jgi:DNA-binding CsgD family transcriptional regulator